MEIMSEAKLSFEQKTFFFKTLLEAPKCSRNTNWQETSGGSSYAIYNKSNKVKILSRIRRLKKKMNFVSQEGVLECNNET